MARVTGDDVALSREQARQRLQMCLGAELTKPKLQPQQLFQQPTTSQGQGQGLRISFRRGSCQYLPLSASNSSNSNVRQYNDILSPTSSQGRGFNPVNSNSNSIHSSQSLASIPAAYGSGDNSFNSQMTSSQTTGKNPPPGYQLAYRVNYGEKPSGRPSPSPMTSYQSPTVDIAPPFSSTRGQMTPLPRSGSAMGYDPEVSVLSYNRPSPSGIEGRMSSVMSPIGSATGGGSGVPLMTILATRPRLAQRRPSEDLTALRRQAYMRQLGLGQGQGHAFSVDTAGGPASAGYDDLMSRYARVTAITVNVCLSKTWLSKYEKTVLLLAE
jgi:hypothetical protein